MPRRKRVSGTTQPESQAAADRGARRVLYLPYPECRAEEGELSMEGGAVALCGCARCRPQLWCSALGPDGRVCPRPRSRRPEAREFQYCDAHYWEHVCRQPAAAPRDVLEEAVRAIYRAELKHNLKFSKDKFCSAAGLLAAVFLPAARRAGLIDAEGRPTFEL